MSALGKDYDNTLTDLKVLAEKEENEGTFAAIVGAIDSRTPEQVGSDCVLHDGYSIPAGIRGSKLSGGQK